MIGGVQLSDGEQKVNSFALVILDFDFQCNKIYYRHPSTTKITHASINAARSLCCKFEF